MAVETAQFGMPAHFEFPAATSYPRVETFDPAVAAANEAVGVEGAMEQVVPIAAQDKGPYATMTIDEAADYLRVSRARIMNAIRGGQLPGGKVGNTFRVVRADLDEYMRGKRAA